MLRLHDLYSLASLMSSVANAVVFSRKFLQAGPFGMGYNNEFRNTVFTINDKLFSE